MSNKHIQRWPASLAIRKIHIKTTIRHHFIPYRTKILKIDNVKY